MAARILRGVIGADLGGTKLRIVRFDGDTREVRILPTGPGLRPADIEAALPDTAALGLAVPGLVEDGAIVACNVLPGIVGWRPRVGTLLNDAQAALVADMEDPPAGTTAAIVMAGTAIGAAIAIDGRSYGGAHGFAGELGYMPMDGGTLDDKAGGAAILRACGCDAPALAARLAAGDGAAIAAVRDAGAALGAGLATLANLIDPARVTLAGGTCAWPGYVDAARAAFAEFTLAPIAARCELRLSPWGADIVARGAAISAETRTTR